MRSHKEVGLECARIEAKRLVEEWGGASLSEEHLAGSAVQLGLRVVWTRFDGARAQLIDSGNRRFIVLSDQLTTAHSRRWVMAHEIGHFVLEHAPNPSTVLCPSTGSRGGRALRRCQIEEEADLFALHLLLPTDELASLCDALPMTLEAPMQLARRRRVPICAAAFRITEVSWRICALVVSEGGRIRMASPSFRWLALYGRGLRFGQQVSPVSVAARLVHGGRSMPPRLVPASAWISGQARGGHDQITLQEHSIWVKDCDSVVTMLSVPDEPAHTRDAAFDLEKTAAARNQLLAALRGEPAVGAIELPGAGGR
jgi:hypothetical protein